MKSSVARDMGLERISRSTRWMAVGLLAGGGVLSAAVAKTLPGRSAASHSLSTPFSTTTVPAPVNGGAQTQQPAQTTQPQTTQPQPGEPQTTQPQTTQPPLTAPAQVPQPVSNPPVVSSGGS